jgi:intein-encoded DNA endonuclease-like protein
MTKYNISSFIPIMQNGLIENSKQEVAGRLLLDSIAIIEEIDISKDMVSNLVKQKSDVHNKIKKASARPEVMEAAIEYFEGEVLTDLNPNLEDDVCMEIINSLKADISVSDKKREELISLYRDGKIGEFLAMSFIYAIGKPNKQSKKKEAQDFEIHSAIDDAPLIYEVDNCCPLCPNLLTKTTVKGKTTYKYSIVSIYPGDLADEDAKLFKEAREPAKNLNTHDNKIALCHDCAEDYVLDTELEEYIALFDIKQRYAHNCRIKQELSGMVLEGDINEVIHALGQIDNSEGLQKLSLAALEIKQKIHPENALLLRDLKNDVLDYYRFIQDVFSQIGNFELIASEVRATFYKIEKDYPDQNEIVEQLANWVLEKSDMPSGRNTRRACEIIVAFFVQNCEVFYEISR